MTDASTIFALSSAPGRAGVAVIRLSGSGGARRSRKDGEAVAEAALCGVSDYSSSQDRRSTRRGRGAVVRGALERNRRGRRRVPGPRQPRRHRRGSSGAGRDRGLPPRRARRICPPGVRERQARPRRGRRSRRSRRSRNGGPAPAGLGASRRGVVEALRGVADAPDRDRGADRGGHRLFRRRGCVCGFVRRGAHAGGCA